MSRALKIALAVVLVFGTSPVWGFEVLYRVFLPTNRPELPAMTDATPLEMDALWLECGERSAMSQNVTPLWALNYFRAYEPGADPRPGVHPCRASPGSGRRKHGPLAPAHLICGAR
jgi:hypothetical protein